MIQTAVVFCYLALVLYIGVFACRRSRSGAGAEDYFLAGRSLGAFVFLFSLFGSHMTAFAILGASGHAFSNGIVTFGLMASSSAIVVPVALFSLGTRLWAVGKRHGFITQVQMFRDRWECGHIGTVIFAVQAALLVPYVVVGVIGGGTTLSAVSGGRVPFWIGGALVAVVVMTYVFFGGMRGTAWVNTFQTLLFLSFGTAAVLLIGSQMGGFRAAAASILESPALAPLFTRERISPGFFFSYTFIPLSALAFPHIAIFCLTAKKLSHFRKTIVLYPICIVAVWLPSVYLGVMANRASDIPQIASKLEARQALATAGPGLDDEERVRLRREAAGDDVMLLLLNHYAPVLLAGILGAGIMAAVMASDSQILALSTMFAEDVFAYYGGRARFGEAVQVHTGRIFVVVLTLAAYVAAMRASISIFELAVQYAFSGYAALLPLLAGALLWKGSTKWGALVSALWVAASVLGIAVLQASVPPPPPGTETPLWSVLGRTVLSRTAGGTSVLGYLPVVPMTLISGLLMVVVSWLTPKPSAAALGRYFAAGSAAASEAESSRVTAPRAG